MFVPASVGSHLHRPRKTVTGAGTGGAYVEVTAETKSRVFVDILFGGSEEGESRPGSLGDWGMRNQGGALLRQEDKEQIPAVG